MLVDWLANIAFPVTSTTNWWIWCTLTECRVHWRINQQIFLMVMADFHVHMLTVLCNKLTEVSPQRLTTLLCGICQFSDNNFYRVVSNACGMQWYSSECTNQWKKFDLWSVFNDVGQYLMMLRKYKIFNWLVFLNLHIVAAPNFSEGNSWYLSCPCTDFQLCPFSGDKARVLLVLPLLSVQYMHPLVCCHQN